MELVNRPIPSMLNGISQQPASLRSASQSELQINALSSLADGLTKRPPTFSKRELSATTLGDIHTTVLDYGGDDQFLMVLSNGSIDIFDKDGIPKTVNTPAGVSYLTGVDPVIDFAVVSVEDVAYITNKTVLTALTSAVVGGGLTGYVQTFANLPGAPAVGDVYKIVGDDTVFLTGYYVRWGGATWTQTAFPGTKTTFDATTMPHKVTWDGLNTFTFDVETWDTRQVGDVTSCPEPNFVGRAIRDVFFHRNRLGLLAGEYCVLSQSGPDYQNFWRQSAIDLLDNDRIDVRAAHIQTSQLNYAVPFNRQLVLLSDKTQFVMGTDAGQLLTPSTSAIDVATSYAANSVAFPVTTGNSVYFPSEDELFAQLREYTVSDDTEVASRADDVTAHCPAYIPAGVMQMSLAENDDMLLLLTSGDQTRLYVYKYFYVDGQKVQSSWSYWQFDDTSTIRSVNVIDSTLYIISEKADGRVMLEHLYLKDNPSLVDLGFTVHLDELAQPGSISAGSGQTIWFYDNPDWPTDVEGDVLVIEGATGDGPGSILCTAYASGTGLVTSTEGEFPDATDVWIGKPYEMRYRFSELFRRPSNDPDRGTPSLDGKLRLRTMSVRYAQTGYFRTEVTPRQGATPYEYVFTGKVLGTPSLILGAPNIATGTFKFPLAADSQRVTIDLVNDSHMPSSFVSAEWSGSYNPNAGSR